MAKKDCLKEMREGFDKWVRLCCAIGVMWIFFNILPHLPTEIGNRIVEAILRKLGV